MAKFSVISPWGYGLLGKLLFLVVFIAVACCASEARAYVLFAEAPDGTTQCSNGPGCSGSLSDELSATGLTAVAASGSLYVGGSPVVSGSASADLSGYLKAAVMSGAIGGTGFGSTATALFDGPVTLLNPCSGVPGVCVPPSGTMTVSLFLHGTVTTGVGARTAIDGSLRIRNFTAGSDSVPFNFCWSRVVNYSSCDGAISTSFTDVLSVSLPISFVDPTYLVDAELQVSSFGDATIDFSHTATFGISLPNGVTYTSPMAFLGPETTAVSEPSSLLLAAMGLVGLQWVRFSGRSAKLRKRRPAIDGYANL